MTINRLPRQLDAAAIALTIMAATVLTACGASPSGPGQGSASTGPATQAPAATKEVAPTQLKDYDPNNPVDVPTDIPQPIPNPAPPANPKELAVRAVANTVNSTAIRSLVATAPSVTSVSVTLTWSKVDNASSYRVSRNEDGTNTYAIRANVPASFRGFLDGGASVLALKVQHEYAYQVEALDSAGNVIAKGSDKAKALYPLPVPSTIGPENNSENTNIQPQFTWNKVDKATGYYVEVFSGVYYVPMWRGYRDNANGTAIHYGDNEDIMDGTFPSIFCTPLNPAGVYTWSVTAVQTDNKDASLAKAWSKSNSNAWRFYCGAKPVATTGGK